MGSLGQVVGDVAELGAAEVILDPHPDRPRPRDYAAGQRALGEIGAAVRDLPEPAATR